MSKYLYVYFPYFSFISEITSNDDSEYLLVIEKVCKKVGKPKNYGIILEEVEEEERRQAEQQLKERAAQRAEAERREEEEAQQRDQRWGEWVSICIQSSDNYSVFSAFLVVINYFLSMRC